MLTWQEIEHLTFLERTTLSSDLSQGYSLKMLTGRGLETRALLRPVFRRSDSLSFCLFHCAAVD